MSRPAAARSPLARVWRAGAWLARLVAAALAAVGDRRQLGHAKRALAARDDLLAVVCHDLRNPLNAVALSANLLARTDLQPAQRRQVDNVTRAAKRMQRLIDDLLDMAALQAGQMSLVPAQHSLGEMLEEAVAAVQPIAAAQKVEVASRLDTPGARLYCDRGRILQVLQNLLGNAIKFSPEGATVTLCAAVRAGEACIDVIDHGAGIEIAEMPYIFDAYWSAAKNARKGTGLGLFISRAIVEAHGGRISAASTPAMGSTFSVRLPGGTVPAAD